MKNHFGFGLIIIIAVLTGYALGRASKSDGPDKPVVQKAAQVKASAGAEGGLLMRGPKNAKVSIVEFADFRCPYCRKASDILQKVTADYPRDVSWTFRHFPLSRQPGTGSFLIHEAAACSAEQGKFWEFHDKALGGADVGNKEALSAVAGGIGLDMKAFAACFEGGKYRDHILKERNEGVEMGVQGTPSFFINGLQLRGSYDYENLKSIIETVKQGQEPSLQQGLMKTGPVEFDDLDKRPSVGPNDAKVTIVEFGDYHCPFCKRLFPTIQKIGENYGDQVRHVFRHFPLPMHSAAKPVHQAAECAFLQGKFWEFHAGIFEGDAVPKDQGEIRALAKKAGLDMKAFDKCVEKEEAAQAVETDMAVGSQSGVEGTPSTFVNGVKISGAVPYETLEAAVKAELEKK